MIGTLIILNAIAILTKMQKQQVIKKDIIVFNFINSNFVDYHNQSEDTKLMNTY